MNPIADRTALSTTSNDYGSAVAMCSIRGLYAGRYIEPKQDNDFNDALDAIVSVTPDNITPATAADYSDVRDYLLDIDTRFYGDRGTVYRVALTVTKGLDLVRC